jgi:hypothetical protein
LYDEDPTRAPTILFFREGVHEVDDEYLNIHYPVKIVGAGRDKTTIQGGFSIGGTKEDGKKVELQDMTIKGSSGCGLEAGALDAEDGLSFSCTRMTFTQCGCYGVYAYNTKGRLINCVITQCGLSGIICANENALIELEGSPVGR